MTTRPAVIPMLSYEDGCAAMEWLAKAFGFQETKRRVSGEGRLAHGEMEAGGGVIMVAAPSADYEGPRHHREHCEQARKVANSPFVVDGILVHVDNVDAHYARAKAAGATLLCEPTDAAPGRLYRAEDLEGHRWMFIQSKN